MKILLWLFTKVIILIILTRLILYIRICFQNIFLLWIVLKIKENWKPGILVAWRSFLGKIFNEEFYNEAIIIKKSGSAFVIQSLISIVLWHQCSNYINEEITYDLWNDKKCGCQPKFILYSDFNNENFMLDSNDIFSFKTIKWIHIYDSVPKFNKKDLFDVLFAFLSVNRELSIKFIDIEFEDSNDIATKFELSPRSLVFVTQASTVAIKFDVAKIEINGQIKAKININQSDYVIIKWFKFAWRNMNVKYDVNNELLKKIKDKSLKDMCSSADDIFILVNIKDIKIIELYFPNSLGIISKSISKYNIKIIQHCKNYEMFDLVQNIKYIPRNLKLHINDYFSIDHWIFDKSINEFWKLILEFKYVIFQCKNYHDIAITGTIGEFDYDDLYKNMFKINIDGKDEAASYKILLILICN